MLVLEDTCPGDLKYRHLISAPIDWMSARFEPSFYNGVLQNVHLLVASRCDPVPEVENATKNHDRADEGETITFTCKEGHRYKDESPNKNNTCNSNQEWDSMIPPCHGRYYLLPCVCVCVAESPNKNNTCNSNQ